MRGGVEDGDVGREGLLVEFLGKHLRKIGLMSYASVAIRRMRCGFLALVLILAI